MKTRCYNKNERQYATYGGRGVKVCNEWLADINAFCEWAIKNGWKKGLQLDKDSKGNGLLYSPKTCCFLTQKENCRYRRTTKRYLFKGKKRTLPEISEMTGINMYTLWHRVNKKGMTATMAVKYKRA